MELEKVTQTVETDKKTNRNKTIKRCLIVLLILAIPLSGYIGYTIFQQKQASLDSVSGYFLGEGAAPDLSPEEIAEMLQRKVDESEMTFSIYTDPIFKGKTGTIMFANPKYSAHNIALEVEVDGKVIIRTEKIAPNQYIEEISLLTKALPKGNHKALGKIVAYQQETDAIVGRLEVDMTIKSV